MQESSSYKTIFQPVKKEIEKIKGSRFLAFLEPAADRESAELRLKEIKKNYPDATHHCFAYITGGDKQYFQRYSDDGEPAGTAGRPILQVLEGHDLKNALLVVVRYYGGTKLGTGGLVKAYTEAAVEAIQSAEIVLIEPQSAVVLEYEYSLHNLMLQIFENYSVTVLKQEFAARISVELEIKTSLKNQFIAEAIDKSHGQVELFEENM